MLGRPRWWRALRGRARADALDLIGDHGRLAYGVARELARGERLGILITPALRRGHWERVRREVRRRERRAPD